MKLGGERVKCLKVHLSAVLVQLELISQCQKFSLPFVLNIDLNIISTCRITRKMVPITRRASSVLESI